MANHPTSDHKRLRGLPEKNDHSKLPVNRIIIGSLSIILALSVASLALTVILVQAAHGTTVAARPTPTLVPTATATLMPTPTLVAIPTPKIGQSPYVDLNGPPVVFEAYLLDPTTGRVLFARNSTTQQAMASTTKIMTALVAILFGNLNQVITVPAEADWRNIPNNPSRMGILQGQQYSLRQLLYGLLLPSGDDTAIAIADGVLGSQKAYVARMNLMAQWLGLAHTHFADVHGIGLDVNGNYLTNHYTTAADLARLTMFALTQPFFQQIVDTAVYDLPATTTHPAFHLENTDILLQDPTGKSMGINGVKTGFTGAAGECVVLHATLQGHQLIAVIMGDGLGTYRFTDGLALIEWGFQVEGLHLAAH